MIRLEAVRTSLIAAGAAVLIGVTGCGTSESPEPSSPQEVTVKSPPPQIELLESTIQGREGEELTFRPKIANSSEIVGHLVFRHASGKLPQGCRLDTTTGELKWTPTETQGPGRYRLTFSCAPESQPTDAAEYGVELNIVEANSPPALEAPAEATVNAGGTLEQSLGVVDGDFPANRLTLQLQSGPPGAVVDDLGKLLFWEVPEDWQQPEVRFTIVARDDGTPSLSATHALVVKVTDIQAPQPKQPIPQSTDRLPEVAVDLPPLRTFVPQLPGQKAQAQEPVEAVPLEFSLDPPVDAEDVRLSLMLPEDLRPLLKTRYIGDNHAHLAVLLTEGFEPVDVPGNLEDGIVATCELQGSTFLWKWAYVKDGDPRGYQNNIRHGVLVIGSKAGAPPRLVALQTAEVVSAPTLADMLGDEKLQKNLTRHEKVKKNTPLEGYGCAANNKSWAVDLESQIDGFSLYLVNEGLPQRLNARRPANAEPFTRFNFRVLPLFDEIVIDLDATPSPADAMQNMLAARKSLARRRADARQWDTKLARARFDLANAQRLPSENSIQRREKQTKVNQALRAIAQAESKLAALAIKIPQEENLVKRMTEKWNAIDQQLQPFKDCTVTGELCRRIGDVRVSVLRMVPVELPPPDLAQP